MKNKVILFFLCLLVIMALPLARPQSVWASTSQVYASKDNYIDKLYPTTNYGSGSYLWVGMPAGGYPTRALLEFPITWGVTIPVGATITSAVLYMRYNGHAADNPVGRTIYVQRMLRLTWSEVSSTWNLYKSGSSWTTEGCGSSSTDYTTTNQASSTVPSSYGWMTWTITAQVQWAQSNNCNVAIRVVDSSEALAYLTSFSSREGSYSPYILINWIAPPAITTGAATNVLNTTATLGATITNTGGSTVTTRGVQYGLTQTPTWNSNETGSFGVGDYSRNVTGLSPGTSYWFRGYATNGAGTGYGSWVSFTTKDYPSILTMDASNVAGTSARLNSGLASDGGDPCTIKFGWGLTSESAVENYDSYDTLTGTYTTGNYPYLDVSGLLSGHTYYFRVSATNIIGTDVGEQLTFETPVILEAPTNFIGYPEATSISLTWSKGIGSTNTLVRYGQTVYPGATTEGTEAYFGPGSTYTLAGLTSGKTYYFSAWGETGGNYSTNYATLLMTTSASAGGITPDMDVPTQPSRWFSPPDYTSMQGLGLIYDALNSAMDCGRIPRETGWFLGAVGLALMAGLIAYLKLGKKLMIGMAVLTVGLAMGYFVRLVPWWLPLMTLILVIAFSMTHKQVSEG